jgi:soluble lytic murein transglycosylase-like protein
MTDYLESIEHYETPLANRSPYFANESSVDPVRQVQIRMVVIFGIVLMVASALSLLALPINVGMGSGSSENMASNGQALELGLSDDSAEVMSAKSSAGVISPLFTPEVQYWSKDIVRWANEHQVDPNAVATIMQIESCGNPQAVSVAGARGLFQVMPFHFSAGEEMTDPETNAKRGLNFFNEQLRYTSGDIFLSFAGYNGGYAASGGDYATWPDETKRYYQWAKGIYEDAKNGAVSSETLNAWLDAGGRPGCQIAAQNLGL